MRGHKSLPVTTFRTVWYWAALCIKGQSIQPDNPYPHLWIRFSLMARGSGSVVATPLSQAQRCSNRANRGLNGRDVQLAQLGEQLVAPTRVAKRSFVPEEGIELEINARAPVPKKRCTRVSFSYFPGEIRSK